MSKEWTSLIVGCSVGALFGSGLWMVLPKREEVTLYYHQVGIYAKQENAVNMKNQIEGQGLDAYVLDKDDNAVVVCGFVFSKGESSAVESTLQGAGMPYIEKTIELDHQYQEALEKGEVEDLIEELESR